MKTQLATLATPSSGRTMRLIDRYRYVKRRWANIRITWIVTTMWPHSFKRSYEEALDDLAEAVEDGPKPRPGAGMRRILLSRPRGRSLPVEAAVRRRKLLRMIRRRVRPPWPRSAMQRPEFAIEMSPRRAAH